MLRLGHTVCIMGVMTDKDDSPAGKRVPLILTPAELEELDDWRFKHRQPTRTAALKALMRLGYEATKTTGKTKPSST